MRDEIARSKSLPVAYYQAMKAATADRPLLLGRYTLLEKLGEGGHGEVWRAHDATLGIDIALKVLSPALARSETAWEALEHEHEVAGQLDHPSILKVYSPQRDAEAAALPMELAPRGDLRRLRGGSYLQIMPPLLEIAAALHYAHEQGVIHRDLKPGNVLFDANGRAVLADFGVAGTAFAAGRDKLRSGLSPFTSSPQQLRGEPPAVSDDVYGFGALVYELLAGQPPYYPHFDLERVLDLEEPVPELRTVKPTPPQLVKIVMHMLQKQPRSRPASMRVVIDEFEAAMNDTLHFEFDPAPEPQTPRREAPKPSVARPRAPSARDSKPLRAAAPPSAIPASHSRPRVGPSPIRSAAVAVALDATHAATSPGLKQPVAAPLPPPKRTWAAGTPLEAAQAALARERAVEPAPAPRPPARDTLQVLPWQDLKMAPMSGLMRPEQIKARRWPWVILALLVAIAAAALFALPRYGRTALAMIEDMAPATRMPAVKSWPTTTPTDVLARARLRDMRAQFDRQMAALQSRGADSWGGREFSDAKMRSAEALGADEAGNPRFAAKRLGEAQALLNAVEKLAPTVQLAAAPEVAGDESRAQRDSQHARTIDPRNKELTAGPARAPAASPHEGAANPVGVATADVRPAEDARAFGLEHAPQAVASTAPVDNAAQRTREIESLRQQASALEGQERWDEALDEYEAALKSDPSLVFAQQGKTRSAARALLAQHLQRLIDNPEQLGSTAARADALALIKNANEESPSGPVLRSQVARLQILLPAFDTPVHVALISDAATQVAIPSVGFSGVFSRHDIQLNPGKYTVIGTRNGYRDVRRDITIAPGEDVQMISVTCAEPI